MYHRTNKSSGNYRNQENHVLNNSRDDSKSGEKDYQRLHITNIPKEWQESALRNVFSSYGTLVECFLSGDKNRRYGLVSYTSHGHAWKAMTELNKTEPHQLNVAIAYKSKKNQDEQPRRRADRSERFNESYHNNNDADLSLYNDRSSNHSNTNHSQRNDMTEIDSVYSNLPEDVELLDDDLSLEMEKLRLIEAQIVYKQRLRSFAVAERRNAECSGRNVRRMTSDGTIVVQSNGLLDAPNEILQTNLEFAIPRSSGTVQSSLLKSALCMTCNAVTALSCAKCRATPYCSDVCSERDTTRHRGQCSTIVELRKGKADTKDSKSFNTSSTPGKNAQGKPKVEKAVENNNSGSASNIPPLRQPKTEYRNNIRSQENKSNNQDQNKTLTNFGNQSTNKPRQNNYERNNTYDQPRSFNQRSENAKQADKPESLPKEVKTPVQTKPVQPAPVRPTTVQLTPSRNAPVQTTPGKSATEKIKKTITEPLSPKNCIADKLNPGDQIVLDVQSTDPSFMIPSGSMLCLVINEEFSEHYSSLFDELTAVCDADNNDYCVTPGNTCCIKNEGAWYRARCLNQTQMALLDASKIITKTNQPIRKLPAKYHDIVEFCCLLQIAVKCENMIGTIKERKANGSVGVELMNPDDGSVIGEGTLSRWLPECTVEVVVEIASAGKTVPKESTAATSEPLLSLSRPPLKNSIHVVIVHLDSLDRIVLLPCDEQTRRQYDNVLHRGALFAESASPMKVPAIVGQMVLAKYTDGVHYRALVNRTNVAQNRYRVEYVEFGNYEVTSLDRLVECPPELHVYNEPALVSIAAIKSEYPESKKALEYLKQLKSKSEILIMTLENGSESAPSGSFVNLTIEDTREDVNRAVSLLCKPQWAIMEEKGESIHDIEIIMDEELSIVKLEPKGGFLRILDSSMLDIGRVACTPLSDADRNKVLNKLRAAMEAYANSSVGKAQYLPRYRELCIVHYESCWHRALLCEQDTPGSDPLVLLLVDSGALVSVPAAHVRKMLREFLHQLPAHVVDVYIRDWPSHPTPEVMTRAKKFLKICDGKENGSVTVTNCVPGNKGSYYVDVSDLLAAINA